MNNVFHTSVVNLEKDKEKKQNILDQFKPYNIEPEFIKAIYGLDLSVKDYYKSSINNNPKFGNRHILTPSEVGCFLSHKEVLLSFLNQEDSNWLLVVEDDVKINKEKFKLFLELDNKELDVNSIYILGGQDGLKCENRFILSPFLLGSTPFKKVLFGSTRWIFRTCCYFIHKSLAKKIFKLLEVESFIIDDWRYIVKKSNASSIYYFNCFEHPIDLSSSSIESERLLLKTTLNK
ncbi:TPA: glycosyltransferase family 25 protein [Photobacterium damselae]